MKSLLAFALLAGMAFGQTRCFDNVGQPIACPANPAVTWYGWGQGQSVDHTPMVWERGGHMFELDPKICDGTLKLGSSTRAVKDIFEKECKPKKSTHLLTCPNGAVCQGDSVISQPGVDIGSGQGQKVIVPVGPLDSIEQDIERHCHIEFRSRLPELSVREPGSLTKEWNETTDLKIVCTKPQKGQSHSEPEDDTPVLQAEIHRSCASNVRVLLNSLDKPSLLLEGIEAGMLRDCVLVKPLCAPELPDIYTNCQNATCRKRKPQIR